MSHGVPLVCSYPKGLQYSVTHTDTFPHSNNELTSSSDVHWKNSASVSFNKSYISGNHTDMISLWYTSTNVH